MLGGAEAEPKRREAGALGTGRGGGGEANGRSGNVKEDILSVLQRGLHRPGEGGK